MLSHLQARLHGVECRMATALAVQHSRSVRQCAPDEVGCITLQNFTVFTDVLNVFSSKQRGAVPRNGMITVQGVISADLDFLVGRAS